MNSAILSALLGFGLIAVFCLAFLAIGGTIAFLFIRRSQQLVTAFANAPSEQGEAYLAAAQLRPWEPGAWPVPASRER